MMIMMKMKVKLELFSPHLLVGEAHIRTPPPLPNHPAILLIVTIMMIVMAMICMVICMMIGFVMVKTNIGAFPPPLHPCLFLLPSLHLNPISSSHIFIVSSHFILISPHFLLISPRFSSVGLLISPPLPLFSNPSPAFCTKVSLMMPRLSTSH